MRKIRVNNSKEEYIVGKIVCVGKNYAEHAKEMGADVPDFPIIFLKPPSALIFNEDEIVHPIYSNEMHHEVELVLLIGEEIKNADIKSAENAIIAYAVGLDMTLRDLQNEFKSKGEPWTLSKCFDTCAVVSEFISKNEYQLTGNEVIKLSVNGIEKQKATVAAMVFPPAEIVKYISEKMTLEKGDLIYTGTPAGVSKVKRGDLIEAEIKSIGTIRNKVV